MDASLLNNLLTLVMLVMLQLILGFDNLLYISLESKNAPPEKQAYARRVGIIMAIVLRIVLLFFLISIIDAVQDTLFELHLGKFMHGSFNLHSLIVLVGGIFIMYTAMKEIWHMMLLEESHEDNKQTKQKSVGSVITMIIIMNLVFSFDSILSAMALTRVFWVMASAIVIGGLAMVLLADRVSEFLAKNRMYEVLGLFVLFLVGIMLISEGGHLAHIVFFEEYPVTVMSKATFYFILVILVIVDVVQGRYQRKLVAMKETHTDIPVEKG